MNLTTKVAIADSNSLFRIGVRSVLGRQNQIDVATEISSFEELHTKFASNDKPDILIMNLSFSNIGTLDFLTEVTSQYPGIPVIALGLLAEEAFAARVLRAGGAAYLKIDCTPDELIEAVNVVKSGRMYLSSRASTAVIEQLQNKVSSATPHSMLSDREYQIFSMICKGIPLVKIGQNFGISVKTVSTYRSRILKKMNMQNNAELIQYAVKNQIVEAASA